MHHMHEPHADVPGCIYPVHPVGVLWPTPVWVWRSAELIFRCLRLLSLALAVKTNAICDAEFIPARPLVLGNHRSSPESCEILVCAFREGMQRESSARAPAQRAPIPAAAAMTEVCGHSNSCGFIMLHPDTPIPLQPRWERCRAGHHLETAA